MHASTTSYLVSGVWLSSSISDIFFCIQRLTRISGQGEMALARLGHSENVNSESAFYDVDVSPKSQGIMS